MIGQGWLGLLGLGARAGTLVVGTGLVRAELQRGRVRAVVLAADRSQRTEQKVERLARAKGVPVMRGPSARSLGQQLGRSAVQAIGVIDKRLADGLVAKASGRPAGGSSGD